ncbi:MAG TPA: isoprenylcysteine carboxylmethyltransferase family protein [Terriglobales bacterium]|nr:isoprenylcysteine carboxylmethyltransferase family protein [Terriglobales bacterium]
MLLVVLAWILGAGSLVLFVVLLWFGSLGVLELQVADKALLAWDAGLCLVFFLQHSILVRRSVRDAMRNYLPQHCQGVAYTITSGVALLTLELLWQRSATNLYVLRGTGRVAMGALLVLALAGFVWGIGSLKRFDAFGIEAYLAHRAGKQVPAMPLTIRGPYRFVRHPFYAFGIVALWATPVLSVDRLLLNVMFTGWIVLGATLEERDLEAEFGEEYTQYRRAVPMLVPRPWRGWRHGTMPLETVKR